jgi:hypothetical protein
VQVGFFSRKKPLDIVLSVYSDWKTAGTLSVTASAWRKRSVLSGSSRRADSRSPRSFFAHFYLELVSQKSGGMKKIPSGSEAQASVESICGTLRLRSGRAIEAMP